MRISISGKNLDISTYMRETAEKKLSKLSKFFPQDAEAQVSLSVEKNRHIVEVTVPYEGRIIRAEETSGDMYASLDNVVSKLEKQVQRYRTRQDKKRRSGEVIADFAPTTPEEPEAFTPQIVRTKRFDIRPMSEEEAMLQMEMLGHSFFVFENAETGLVNVLYQRKDGNYGLIEPA
ncbi:MAG: ribosome-associated translation inhibitor RaiA [Clostridia bacterium]|nr:ribosome-associated translation inhibitor RaiA [Clostridia bacterium]